MNRNIYSMARWSELRFRCVCTQFRQSVSDLPNLRKQQPPWLLLPYKTGSMCGLYHPFENKVFDIDLPEAGDKVFKGTGHGWVVTHNLDGSMDVLNPLTRARVPLPPRYKLPDVVGYDPNDIGREYVIEYVDCPGSTYTRRASSVQVRDSRWLKKVVLSSSPLSDDFIAVAVLATARLAYYKVGNIGWRDLVDFTNPYRDYHDVTFLGGLLYASRRGEKLMVCDDFRCSCPSLRKCDSVAAFPGGRGCEDNLITNSPDSLLMVRREKDKEIRIIEGGGDRDTKLTHVYSTIGFEMYRLDVDPKTTTGWFRIKSLDDDEILFMGLGTQILFSSRDFIGNQIYFASDHRLEPNCGDIENCFDNGVFDFEDGKFYLLSYECSSRVIWPLPIWFTPNPY